MSADEFRLILVCGTPPAPGDTNTAETGIDGAGLYTLDLSGKAGFGINNEDWIAQVAQPQIVRSGVIILEHAYQPVTEILNLTALAGVSSAAHALKVRLGRFAQLIADYWAGVQPNPVYLIWKAKGAPGDQYALIYNLNYADKSSAAAGYTTESIVLTLEREPFWRGVWPGGNPMEWTLYAAGLDRGATGFTYSQMSVYQHTNALADDTIENMAEHSGLNAFYTTNWLDIPATSVPGDAPALCMITAKATAYGYEMVVGLRSGPTSVLNRAGSTVPQFYKLAGVDVTTLTGMAGVTVTKVNNADGLRGVASTVNAQTARFAFTAAATGSLIWNNNSTYLRTVSALWRGRFAVYLRGGVTSGSGSPTAYLEYGTVNNKMKTESVSVGTLAPSATTEWGVTPLGVISLPVNSDTLVSPDGRGLSAPSGGNYDVEFKLYVTSPSGTYNFELCDLVFIPVDEGAVRVGDLDRLGATTFMGYDNTGYYSRGKETPIGISGSASTVPTSVPIYGQSIYLKPGINNRLYFLMTGNGAPLAPSRQSKQDDVVAVTCDIIPRWLGRRDA